MIGIIEGFYGPYYDLSTRSSLVEFMSRIGMNTYIYAPKDDPYHRNTWRSPYPISKIEEFEKIIQLGKTCGVEVVYALSPGLDIDYSSKEDFNYIIRKLGDFMNLGCKSLAILLDDIPPILRGKGFKTLAEAQSNLVNKVYKELGPKKLIFCPTFYFGINDYLEELGRMIYPEIDIMWTGMKIVPISITIEDLEKITNILDRNPFIWDNYPVNDYFTIKSIYRLHLGPIMNRAYSIKKLVSGYVANLANQPELSKIPLYTISRAIENGEKYDPWKSSERAIDLLVNKNAKYWFKVFFELNKATFMNPEEETVTKENADEILEMIKQLNETLENKMILKEIKPVLNKIESIARYAKGEKVYLSMKVQTAGEYIPPISSKTMVKEIFGKTVCLIPWYYSAYAQI